MWGYFIFCTLHVVLPTQPDRRQHEGIWGWRGAQHSRLLYSVGQRVTAMGAGDAGFLSSTWLPASRAVKPSKPPACPKVWSTRTQSAGSRAPRSRHCSLLGEAGLVGSWLPRNLWVRRLLHHQQDYLPGVGSAVWNKEASWGGTSHNKRTRNIWRKQDGLWSWGAWALQAPSAGAPTTTTTTAHTQALCSHLMEGTRQPSLYQRMPRRRAGKGRKEAHWCGAETGEGPLWQLGRIFEGMRATGKPPPQSSWHLNCFQFPYASEILNPDCTSELANWIEQCINNNS